MQSLIKANDKDNLKNLKGFFTKFQIYIFSIASINVPPSFCVIRYSSFVINKVNIERVDIHNVRRQAQNPRSCEPDPREL